MQDMVPPQERSIRNIPLTATNRRNMPPQQPIPPRPPVRERRSSGLGRFWLWAGIVIISCAVIAVLLSTLFEGTTVTLYPHTASVTPTQPITAAPDATTGTLAYQALTLNRSASINVSASGEQQVSKSASGAVTIFNAYSSASLKLIANTRFEAANGNIYRIHSSVVVPGATGSGSSLKPGSITATIYADQPGASYNIESPTSFTIPGLKTDPGYSKYYAQSQGAITGGLVGDEPSIVPSDLTTAQNTLKGQLGTAIASGATTSVPQGYLIIPSTLHVTYSDPTENPISSSTVTISQTATGMAVALRITDLASAVATQSVSGYKGEPVTFVNPSAVSVSVATSSGQTGTLSLMVGGPVTLIWEFDAQKIKEALVGKPKASFESIIATFEPAIEKADAKVRPFWESNFPSNPNKINVVVAPQP